MYALSITGRSIKLWTINAVDGSFSGQDPKRFQCTNTDT